MEPVKASSSTTISLTSFLFGFVVLFEKFSHSIGYIIKIRVLSNLDKTHSPAVRFLGKQKAEVEVFRTNTFSRLA